jgi:hypothetical protein
MTAPRVTTPWRSSNASAAAVARRVGLASRSGNRYHRPAALGGPDRALAKEDRLSRLAGILGALR